jgi:glycosyltransferase involved in cell wall biosynthesis
MRVCYVSTYPPIECGIASYTKYLSEAVQHQNHEVIIVSQNGAKGDNVFPVYSPLDNDIATRLFHITSKLTPDVINIQHEYNLYGSESGVQLLDFLYRCKIARLPAVTTLHTLYEDMDRTQQIILEGITSTSSAVIVHEEYQKETLAAHFPKNKDKYFVIPHGIRKVNRVENAKKILGLEGKKVILLTGYFRPSKGFHRIVKIFPEIADELENVVLLVTGKMRGLEFGEYRRYFFDLINSSTAIDKIMVLSGQFPQQTFDTIMSAADVLALPYEIGAQSGILAQSTAFNVPVVMSPLKSFVNWNETVKGGVIAETDEEYKDALIKLLTDDTFYNGLKENLKSNKATLLWPEIAKKHLDVYGQMVETLFTGSKYLYIP